MAKTTTAKMDTHLRSEVTSLAMAALIERTDGQKFRLTTSSEDIRIDIGDGDGEQTYLASEGVGRTNIESDAELNVDNLDVVGVFDNSVLKEEELRRGLFDFADFKIFVFNHQDANDGIIKIFRGELGEVTTVPRGFFSVTVRSLVQVYGKETGEHYTKDCRADLGDIRCAVPIFPDEAKPFDRSFPVAYIKPQTAYRAGDFLLVPTVVDPTGCSRFIMNFEGEDGATNGPGFANQGKHTDPDAIMGTAQISTAQAPAGGDSTSSLLLDGDSDYLRWNDADAWHFGAGNAVTIQAHIRLAATGTDQTIVAKYNSLSNNREWVLRVTSTNVLQWVTYSNGTTIDVDMTGLTALAAGTDYHVAVVRRNDGRWVMFLDGEFEAEPMTPQSDMWNSGGFGYVGAVENAGAPTDFFNGWIDSLEILVGFARWETPFIKPTGILDPKVTPLNQRPFEDYANRLYEVTTAGTTGLCLQNPNTNIGSTHNQGSVVLTANHSWMRSAEVTAVGSNARKDFTVTELTPNNGHAVGGNRTPLSIGFPNDWFNGGAVFFDTGANAGVAREVKDFVADDGATIEQNIVMFDLFPFDVAVGDKLRIFPGCDKLNATCISKFNNGINFVGEPYVPGEDVLGQYPDAH